MTRISSGRVDHRCWQPRWQRSLGRCRKRKGYGFHVLLDPDAAVAAKYFVHGIPTLLLVDKMGVVRWIRVGYSPGDSDLRRVIEGLLKK